MRALMVLRCSSLSSLSSPVYCLVFVQNTMDDNLPLNDSDLLTYFNVGLGFTHEEPSQGGGTLPRLRVATWATTPRRRR